MSVASLLALSIALLLIPALLSSTQKRREADPSAWPTEVSPLLKIFWWINHIYCQLVHRLVILNQPTVPFDGPALLIANHTSGVDHFILQGTCRRVLGFLIAREFYEVPVGNWFCRQLGCIPVNRNGRDLSAMRAALRALESGRVVPIFPEGRILRTSGREFAEGRPGAAFLAIKANVPIIPTYIRGTPEIGGVWITWFTPSSSKVFFGPPIDLSDLIPAAEIDHNQERLLLESVTERMMQAIKSLQPLSLACDES